MSSTLLPLISREEATRRLLLIFPRDAFDAVLSSPLAGSAVAALIYIGAVADEDQTDLDEIRWARPTMILWMNDRVLTHDSAADREAWYVAALTSERRVAAIADEHGERHDPWYAANTRETLRDETFPNWRANGAVRDKPGMPTTSSKPRWTLNASFAELFNPELTDEQLVPLIEEWASKYMSTSGKLRRNSLREIGRAGHSVEVTLPTGERRQLEYGIASLILKGVAEQWATARLKQPVVLAISEPGAKVFVPDEKRLAMAGIHLNVSQLLPDALLVDIGTDPLQFWIIEAVATDGEINEERRLSLLAWAEEQGIETTQCQFLTAFASRNAAPARRRLKDLAAGTYAWFLDEPDHELAWYDLRASPVPEPRAIKSPQ